MTSNITDEVFFQIFPDRNYHVRKPNVTLERNAQRALVPVHECEAEFSQLGPHKKSLRRILLWRVPKDNPWYNPSKPPILKIPVVDVQDKFLDDTDECLGPALDAMMRDARKQFAD
jgi:hypothetical protein